MIDLKKIKTVATEKVYETCDSLENLHILEKSSLEMAEWIEKALYHLQKTYIEGLFEPDDEKELDCLINQVQK